MNLPYYIKKIIPYCRGKPKVKFTIPDMVKNLELLIKKSKNDGNPNY